MAILSNQVRKANELPPLSNVSDGDVVIVHNGAGLKKVEVSTLKRIFTPTSVATANVSVATSTSNGIVRPDNVTTEVNNGVMKAKTATRTYAGVVKPDNSTINITGDGTISVNKGALGIDTATKIINQNGNGAMKYWFGSKADFNRISNKDANTIYDVYE